MHVPSRLQETINSLPGRYTKAQLRLVHPQGPVPTADPLTLTDIRVYFSAKDDAIYNSPFQDTTAVLGIWGPIHFSTENIPDANDVLEQPLLMDMVTADGLAKAAGFRKMYDRVEVGVGRRWRRWGRSGSRVIFALRLCMLCCFRCPCFPLLRFKVESWDMSWGSRI